MAEAAVSNFKLRVIIDDKNIHKVTFPSRPDSLKDLISLLKEKLHLTFDFELQFEDPDFDNQLCNLRAIEDLPPRATLKVVRGSDRDASSTATSDTADTVLLDVSSPERLSRWPDVFITPVFSYDVEFVLKQGNCDFVKHGKTLRLKRDQKHDILEKVASTIYSFKAYPSDNEFVKAAEALVTKHPCLKETGSKKGYDGWKNSLKYKMGNLRNKLRRIGCEEVSVNGGKRSRQSPNNEPSRSNIKRPRRAEVNFLPNFPAGQDAASLEGPRMELVDEMRKKERNLTLINQKMARTFALRRQQIVVSSPLIKDLREQWPALFLEAQVSRLKASRKFGRGLGCIVTLS